jgi:hypothetical protein
MRLEKLFKSKEKAAGVIEYVHSSLNNAECAVQDKEYEEQMALTQQKILEMMSFTKKESEKKVVEPPKKQYTPLKGLV